jgi:hypothetical protein
MLRTTFLPSFLPSFLPTLFPPFSLSPPLSLFAASVAEDE